MQRAPFGGQAAAERLWSVWLERLIEVVILGFVWAYAAWSGFALVEVIAASLVTCWLLGAHVWRFLRGDDRGPQTRGEPRDKWTAGELLRVVSEPMLLVLYPWVLAASHGLRSAAGVFALGLTAFVAVTVVQEILRGPNPPEPEFKGRIEEIPLHHDDGTVHEFPGMR